ncbi:alpha/beta hydrolase family protein [Flavisolibacter nicotianae]|uniref:alpha/beta hydrolase family protein n=1 Tax=Flavisolibacter nicotianae TaxID=2364882 RepID=UPI000EAFD75E|nr:prolyl oligopeptidase family serine peptidase [Flavisolibacter nicotianae]
MKRLISLFLFSPLILFAQKKPLDHTVYDGWQSIGERSISNDGKWVVYTVTPQEGDANLFIQSTENPANKRQVPRGYNAVMTEDSRFVVFKIKPLYKETREARIKKKKLEDMPKDSIGIVQLGKEGIVKVAKVRSYKVPDKSSGWLAFHKERDAATMRPSALPTQKTVDSLRQKVDSLTQLVVQLKNTKGGNRDAGDADEDPSPAANGSEGSDLVVRNLLTGKDKIFKNVTDYAFSKNGQKLVMRLAKAPKDSTAKNAVAVYDTKRDVVDTIQKGGNDFRGFAFTEDGSKLAFVAERDTNTRALQKFYGLYLYRSGSDSAELLIDKTSVGMQVGMTVSENGTLSFSKSGNRLLFGIAPILPAKDTSLVDFELAKVDVWNYKDDYLQTQQLFNLQNELKRSYLTAYDFGQNKVVPLGSPGLPNVLPTADGDGVYFVAVTDTGRRVQAQWTGSTAKDVYALNPVTGERKLVKKNLEGNIYPSAAGKHILIYDNKARAYFAWNGKELKNVTAKIPVALYDEENDVPDDPNPYGVMGWHEGDSAVYVYDKYDVWKVSPQNKFAPQKLTSGRNTNTVYRNLRVDTASRFISANQPLYFRAFNRKTKASALVLFAGKNAPLFVAHNDAAAYTTFLKARNKEAYLYSKESYVQSPDLYFVLQDSKNSTLRASEPAAVKLTALNPQQSQYNWGTAELYKWKTFNGKESTGILYKPEDFDAKKKYPMLVYFYEKLSDGLHTYTAPAPTPSRLNIPFFVSRGYLVFAPDISYTKGHPGKDAYNYIVSGAKALAKNSWVDAKNIGIQGQSWGGYQVAYLITATNLFKAAWAGAPVVDMFSAYGGIRWESGLNRQFQYEKSQSRIGATPWERPDLYIENSPFFHLKNVTTPLVIMANDADGAVPWYQGIEFFTAMRRLGKKVWMLNYNGEAHNLVERRNRKDIQVREQQYFDWLLKGEKPAKWLAEGVPAVKKGRDWGLAIDQDETN